MTPMIFLPQPERREPKLDPAGFAVPQQSRSPVRLTPHKSPDLDTDAERRVAGSRYAHRSRGIANIEKYAQIARPGGFEITDISDRDLAAAMSVSENGLLARKNRRSVICDVIGEALPRKRYRRARGSVW